LRATHDFSVLAEVDSVSICVPTPLSKTKDPDISYIVSVTDEIRKQLHPGQLIVLESTTYPGTTDEVVLPRLASTGLQVGRDFCLAFSPERIDPGNTVFRLANTPKILGGVTPQCTEAAAYLYQQIITTVVPVSSSRTAEMVKLLENTFRAVNIGLVNEVALMCARLGLDVWEVIDAAATKPFGFMPFYPGPGLGGHCIPLDPHYLAWKLKTLDYRARFIELADDINTNMPHWVVTRVVDVLNNVHKSVKGSKILVLGVAYKADTNDLRESPALDVLRLLQAKGGEVCFHDLFITEADVPGFHATELSERILNWADCVVITTNHSTYNYDWIVAQARLIVDTRNATRHVKEGREKIHTL
jgi:UDP-N-acetyl-D-glucosamine dehydrogenase